MDSALIKSLNSLIDETLVELEDLKKSRFSASEVKLDGPGSDGIAGKPASGSGISKDDDGDKDDDDDDKDDHDMDKGEGKNKEADPGAVHHGVGSDKGAGPREQSGGGKVRAKDGTNTEADLGETHKAEQPMIAKKEDKKDDDDDDDDKEEMKEKMKKSQEEMTSLMKSFVDERIKPLEDKLTTIVDLVNKLADQPVAPKGFTARAVVPLAKSADEFSETLNKSAVTSKLLELKKSGTYVDSLDVAKADMGQDLESIAKKYKIS